MDMNLKVPAIEKLLDYAASGIGSVAGPMLASWRARHEANAKLIAAQGQSEAQRILAEGDATTMGIIASAQADARATLVSPNSTLEGQLEFGETVTQRIRFQEGKRQSNIGQVVTQAAIEIESKEVEDHEPDHDWTARFFNDVQDVSSEEMQRLWARILAGQVERPGSTSIKSLGILKDLDEATATLFRKFCSICVSIRHGGINFEDARVPFLGDYSAGNALRDYGFEFSKLKVLSEHGLIDPEYNTWHDYGASTGLSIPQTQKLMYFPFWFQGKYWILLAQGAGAQRKELKLSGVALTGSGQEISKVVDLMPVQPYGDHLVEHFKKNSLQMVEVPSWEPRIVDSSP